MTRTLWSMTKLLDGLIGKRVTALFVSQGEEDLKFVTDDGDVKISTEGDCCSETWFADITGVDRLLNCTVQQVQDLEPDGYNVEDGRGRQEYDQAYGVRISTDRGDCDIVFRNSSNGYYGGCLAEFWNYPGREERKWREITDDWQA